MPTFLLWRRLYKFDDTAEVYLESQTQKPLRVAKFGSVRVSDDGSRILTAAPDKHAILHEASGAAVRELVAPRANMQLAGNGRGALIWSGRVAAYFDLRTNSPPRIFELPRMVDMMAIALRDGLTDAHSGGQLLSADGSTFVVLGDDYRKLYVYDLVNGGGARVITSPMALKPFGSHEYIAENGKGLLLDIQDPRDRDRHMVYHFDLAENARITDLGTLSSAKMSPDGRRVFTRNAAGEAVFARFHERSHRERIFRVYRDIT